MRRKIMSLVFIALLIAQPILGVVNLGTKKVTEFIGWDLICIDSGGIDAKPDSAHIFTRVDASTTIIFKTRSTTFPFNDIGIDTAKEYGDTTWAFSDQIQDIDGTPTPPTYALSIDVILWNSKIGTHNRAVVQVIGDSLNQATAGAIASLKPTTAGRTLDVTATGEAGVDFDNILGGLGAAEIDADAIGAAELATTAVDEIVDANWDEDIETAHGTDATSGWLLRVLGKGISNAVNDTGLFDQLMRIHSLIESQRGEHSHQITGRLFYVDPANGATHASGARGGMLDPYSLVQDCHDNAITSNAHDLIILLAGASGGPTTLTEAVTISKNYVFIRGPGRDFIWTRSDAGNTITITGDGTELSGFQLNTAATGSGNGIDITDADFTHIQNLWINDTRGDGIHILRGNNTIIVNNSFVLSGTSGAGQGIDISGTAGTSNDIRISDNLFRDISGDAIRISGGTTNDVVIQNNIFEQSAGWGVNIGASSTDAFITDNRFGNNSSGDITDAGTTTITLNNEQWGTADSVNAILDTNQLFSLRIDSTIAALADANFADKFPISDSLDFDDTFWAKLAGVTDSGATGSSPWSSGQRDSVLAAIADANMDDKLTKIFNTTQRDSLLDALADANLFDKIQAYDSLGFTDDFWAKLANVSDSGAAGGSSPWNIVEKDSVLAALADANMGDKIPLGGGASPWTTAQRDSLLSVATDAVFRNKVLGDSLTTPATLERLLIDGGSLVGHDGFSRLFTFVDSANSDAPINQLPVFVNTEAQTMLQPYNGLTDANGNITFNLAAGTWTVYHTSEIWDSFLDTFVVSGSASQTVELFTEVAANHAVILGYIGGVGQFPNGSVEVSLSAYDPSVELMLGDTLYGQNMKSYPADVNGKFEVPLIQTDVFGSDSAFYKFAFKDKNGRRVRVGGQRHIFVSLDTADVTAGVAIFNSLTRVDPQ